MKVRNAFKLFVITGLFLLTLTSASYGLDAPTNLAQYSMNVGQEIPLALGQSTKYKFIRLRATKPSPPPTYETYLEFEVLRKIGGGYNPTGIPYYSATSPWNQPVSVSDSFPDGQYIWRVRTHSTDGQVSNWVDFSSLSPQFQIDTTPPTISQGLTSQSAGQYVRGIINFKTYVTDNFDASVYYYLDILSNSTWIGWSAASPYYPSSWDTRAASNGKHNILTYAYDGAGNSANASTSLNVDNYKPRTKAPYSRKVKKSRYVRLYYKVRDPYTGGYAYVVIRIKKGTRTVKTIKLGWRKIQSGSTVLLKYYKFLANLARGKYKFYIYAKDRAGNTDPTPAYNYLTIY